MAETTVKKPVTRGCARVPVVMQMDVHGFKNGLIRQIFRVEIDKQSSRLVNEFVVFA